MTEDTVTLISGLLGCGVGLYCFIFVFIKGKTRNQKIVEKWNAQGGKTEGVMEDWKILRHGDLNDSGSGAEDYYEIKYRYEVNGKIYYLKLRFLGVHPIKINVYYDPEHPEKCLAGNQATVAEQRGRGCLITIIATLFTMGISANLLLKLFGL